MGGIAQLFDLALHLRRKASWHLLLCHELPLDGGALPNVLLYA